jgi:hypothetical protein
MKKIITVGFLAALAINTSATAGFFDFFSDNEPVVEKVDNSLDVNLSREPNFEVKRLDRLSYHTKKRGIEDLKENYSEIKQVLASFEDLERKLTGFEEKKVVTSLRMFFKDKYLVNQVDLIDIKTNLNSVLGY